MKELAPHDVVLEEFLNRKDAAWLRTRVPEGPVVYGSFDVECNSHGRFLTVSANKDGTLNIKRWPAGGYFTEYYVLKHQRAEHKGVGYGALLAALRWLGYSI